MAGKKKVIPNSQNNQGKKRKKKKPKVQGDRHFCWVCGEHKAHEKFSGRGHATHMCRKCHALPVAERNIMVASRRAENMGFRYLNEQEIKWLRKRMNDSRPEVREAARFAHSVKFPRYERNIIKKGLTACSLEFYINGEVWDEYGDEINVRMRFFADNCGVMRRIDYNAPEGEQETTVGIGHSAALKFLKAVVHQLNAPFWSEDLSDAGSDDYDFCDPYLDILPEHRSDNYADDEIDDDNDEVNFDWALYIDDEDDTEDENVGSKNSEQVGLADDREPIWFLRILLTKDMGEKVQTFYNQMHDEPRDLFWFLMDWFEPGDENENENRYGEDEFEPDDIL